MASTSRERTTWSLSVASVAVLLVGCGADAAAPPLGNDVFAVAYGQALEAGASTEQLDALAEASSEGAMEYGELVLLVEDTLACLADSGIPYQPIWAWERWPGFSMPIYGVGESATLGIEASAAISAECESRHSNFAFEAYQSQPSAQEARDARFLTDLPATLECLAAHGRAIPEGASLNEVRAAVSELAIESGEAGDMVLCSEWAY